MVKKIFNIVGLVINLTIVGLLFLSGFSTQINPEKAILPAYLGLIFLPLVVANIVFALYWIIKFKWYFVFSLFILILMTTNIKNDFPFNKAKANTINESENSTTISLLSYNVKLFDFYKKNSHIENYNKTLDYILKSNADIVCLQEYGYYNSNGFLNADDLLSKFDKYYKYKHISYNTNSSSNSTYGVATFSKYPILGKYDIEYDSKYNHTIFSDIKIKNKTVRIFNCHLESNQLTLDDKKKMIELVDSTSKARISETTDVINKKLGTAYKKRAYQARLISEKIYDSPYEVIVCGDFNDTPISYTYKKIKGNLKDAFVQNASGLGITYNELPFLFRIDYIMTSKNFSTGDFKIHKVNYSDHYPISCRINMNY